MANQRIDQLNAETTPAAADVLPIYSISGSDTKKITVKNLVQRGAALVDDASIPVAKVNLSGISGTNITAGTITAAKLDTSTIPATGGVTVSSSNLQLVAPTSPIVRNAGTGSLEHATSGATAGTYTKVTVDAKGHVTSGTTLVDADIPSPTTTAGTFTKLTIDTKGRVTVGANLAAADVPFADTGVTAGTYTKVTVDAKGRVTSGTTLVDADVPALANSGVAAGTYTKVTVDTKGRVTGGTTLTDADVPALANSGVAAGTYTKLTVDAKGRATAGTTLAAADLPVATSSTVGGVSIPAAGGLALTGGGALSHSNAVAGGASTRSGITYDLQGHIVSTVAIVASDLPAATTSAKGAVIAGTGLAVDVNGILSTGVATTSDLGGVKIGSEFGLNGSNQLLLATQANVAGGTAYPKVTVNSKGVVTAGAILDATDIPNLAATKITSGSLDIARIAANTITGAKIANYAITKIGDTQPTADHIGQFFFNPLSRDLFLFDGNVYQPIGISVGEIVFAGTFDASAGGGAGHVASVTAEGTAIGLVEGSPLPAAATANNRYYLVVSEGGTITSGNAPNVALAPPDIVLSTGIEWTEVDVSQTFTSVSASQVAFTPEGTIAASNVQAAIEEVNNEKLGLAGGTITGTLEIGTTGGLSFEGSTANSFETSITAVDPTADRTITFPNISGTVITTGDTGTVTSAMLLDGTIVDADISATAEISVSKLADGAARQLLQTDAAGTGVEWASNIDIPGTLDVTSAATFDSTVAVTGALTKSGSNVVTVGDTGTVTSAMLLDGTIVNADINASAAIAYSKLAALTSANIIVGSSANVATSTAVTGDVTIDNTGVTSIASGVIVDADINASAAIVDTKLATIATAGKVSNSATTATNANTASAIVARDASGNFTAGTITAALTGTASGNLVSGGALGTPSSGTLTNCTFPTLNQSTTGNASTATTLATARTIQGVSFDGSANITVATAGSGISVTGTAIANTGVLSVNGNAGAITNIAATNAVQSFTVAQRGAITALTDGATITADFAAANNFSVTLGGNRTLANPSNQTAGQSGCIWITQDGTGSRTLAYGSQWDFTGGTAPTLSTAAASVDCLVYAVQSSTKITATLISNLS
jgi:hypothetical protein